ncbi:MAG: hypothetical protein HBSIN02_18910 [Bacteroidia bacterium]|nr:MAG: hypothetical protein HBSIN02_18910 [Bacteroidia bacterium]
MLLTAGAVVLIGLTVSTVQRNFANHGFILQQAEIGIYKVSLGMSVLEEAMGKAFDENTIDTDVSSVNSLTSTLGKESGEGYPDFDDFDDYNNYSTSLGIEGVDSLRVRCSVVYVNPSSPDGSSSSRTWHKKITVKVWGTVQPDTLTFTHVFSYWSFR